MIEQLYIEKRADGRYDVVCNELVTTVPPPADMFPAWVEALIDVGSAIEVLTISHRDECEYPDDIAGIRVGYKPFDLLGLAFNGEIQIVPAFRWERSVERLFGTQS